MSSREFYIKRIIYRHHYRLAVFSAETNKRDRSISIIPWSSKSRENYNTLKLKALEKYRPPEEVAPGPASAPSKPPGRGPHQYYTEVLENTRTGKKYYLNYQNDSQRNSILSVIIDKVNREWYSDEYGVGEMDFRPAADESGELIPISVHTYQAYEYIAKDADRELIFGKGG